MKHRFYWATARFCVLVFIALVFVPTSVARAEEPLIQCEVTELQPPPQPQQAPPRRGLSAPRHYRHRPRVPQVVSTELFVRRRLPAIVAVPSAPQIVCHELEWPAHHVSLPAGEAAPVPLVTRLFTPLKPAQSGPIEVASFAPVGPIAPSPAPESVPEASGGEAAPFEAGGPTELPAGLFLPEESTPLGGNGGTTPIGDTVPPGDTSGTIPSAPEPPSLAVFAFGLIGAIATRMTRSIKF